MGRSEQVLGRRRDLELRRLLASRDDVREAIRPSAEALKAAGKSAAAAELQALAELGARPEWRAAVEAMRQQAEEAAFAAQPKLAARVAEERFTAIARLPHVRAWPGPDETHFGPGPRVREVVAHFEAVTRLEGRFWRLRGEIEAGGPRGPLVRRLLVEPEPNESGVGGVSGTLLRELGLPLIRERALRALEDEQFVTRGDLAERARQLYAVLKRTPPKRGAAGYGDDLFELVALLYVRLKAKHRPHGLNRRTARLFTRALGRVVETETLRSWLREAEMRGFLAKGVARRELGPRFDIDRREEQ